MCQVVSGRYCRLCTYLQCVCIFIQTVLVHTVIGYFGHVCMYIYRLDTVYEVTTCMRLQKPEKTTQYIYIHSVYIIFRWSLCIVCLCNRIHFYLDCLYLHVSHCACDYLECTIIQSVHALLTVSVLDSCLCIDYVSLLSSIVSIQNLNHDHRQTVPMPTCIVTLCLY